MGVYKREQTWCIQYFANGKRRREAIGPSKREAENVLNKRKAEVREGRFFDLRKGDKLTFGEFLDRYLTEYSAHNKAPGTYRSDCLKASPLKAEFGEMRLTAVDTDVVHRYLARLREEGRAPATVNRYRALLSHIFTMAMRWGYVASNPVRLVKLLREDNQRTRFLSPAEAQALLAECSATLRPIILTALHTGMRQEEVLSLKWKQVNRRERTIHVERSKNGRSRVIPMSDELDAMLDPKSTPMPEIFVFRGADGSRYQWSKLRKAFEATLKRAKIEDFRFHDLRHTFASNLIMAGVDLLTVKELLGHQTISMTVRYSHLAPSHKRGAVLALEKALSATRSSGAREGVTRNTN